MTGDFAAMTATRTDRPLSNPIIRSSSEVPA